MDGEELDRVVSFGGDTGLRSAFPGRNQRLERMRVNTLNGYIDRGYDAKCQHKHQTPHFSFAERLAAFRDQRHDRTGGHQAYPKIAMPS